MTIKCWDEKSVEEKLELMTGARDKLQKRVGKLSNEVIELRKDQKLLFALQAAGVDNWEGWDIALESLEEDSSN